jgi:hypothetical protein
MVEGRSRHPESPFGTLDILAFWIGFQRALHKKSGMPPTAVGGWFRFNLQKQPPINPAREARRRKE